MSGDVQVRKRKDKKRKRDSIDPKSEGDVLFRKLSVEEDEDPKEHHGVHATKMGTDDVHLHVQADHETGGHWCAKIFFFSLLAILLGLIGLIIMENRGLSDLDTPLSESRFSEYFEGWVDEHRDAHDDHNVDKVVAEHDGAFDEEEEEHTELDDDHELESEPDEDHEDEEEETEQQDEGVGEDEGSEEEAEANQEEENDVGAENDDEEETYHSRSKRSVPEDDEDEEEEEPNEEEQQIEEDDNEEEKGAGKESDADDEVDEGFDEGDNEEDDQAADEEETGNDNPQKPSYHSDAFDEATKNSSVKINLTKIKNASISVPEIPKHSVKDKEILGKPKEDNFDEDDEEPPIDIVENDDGETLHLQQKKAQEEPEEGDPNKESSSSSLAVKIAVGVALAFVARLVLIRQNRSENTSSIKLEPEPEFQLREVPKSYFPEAPIKYEEHYDVDEELEEEYEEEEEEEEQQEIHDISDEEDKLTRKYSYEPTTFEQFNAMYRPKGFDNLSTEDGSKQSHSKADTTPQIKPQVIPKTTTQHKEEHKPVSIDTAKRDTDIKKTGSIESQSISKSETPSLSSTQVAKTSFSPQQASAAKEPMAKITPFMAHDRPNRPAPTKEQKPQEAVRGNKGLTSLYTKGPIGHNKPLPDDLLDEEEYEEELEEEEIEDDEEISDVDDDDLMKRLEAKYGKLPQKTYESGDEDDDVANVSPEEEDDVEDPSWTKVKSRGPQSAYDEDAFLEEELRRANEELLQNNFKAALNIYDSLILKNPKFPGALRGKATVLDKLAEKHRSNQLLTEAIQFYEKFLNNAENVDDETFITVANRCIEKMRFIGLHLKAITIQDKLIKRFPNDPHYPNQMAITFLLVNRLADAKRVLHNVLQRWPDDGFAKVHYGFVLKNLDNNLEKAVVYLKEGIESKANGTEDGRFYFNLGDALQRLGRRDEAMDVYKKGAEIKLFPSKYQRSLYNVDHLLAKPFWTKKETTYEKYFDIIEQNFQQIKQEGLSAMNAKGFFVDEAESLKDVGDWKQFEIFARGFRNTKNCQKAPFTCKIIESFPAARNCKRGQVKFSVMHPGTHVWPHCGPTNCRLRAHLGLQVPPYTTIRVADEKRSWEEGKLLIFDDSFEHEVWHNGTTLRLVLIIDVWHPDLSQQERDQLSRI